MTEAQGSTGRLLAGRYRLESVLGRGGMGTVWRAEDEMLGRVVAVKELRFHGGVDEEEKRRLITRTLREAKATARIRHVAAVTVFDVVEEDDRPWIVMELVESRSLSDVIKQDGPLKPRRAAEIGLDLLGVLRSAHGHGILHRDVKPSNVLIGDDGRVVLTDFGIASVEGDPSVTSTGMLVGAPSYISPERARGQKPGPPADLWSLGATLYAMVEGKPPYDRGSAISTLTAVMTEDLKTPGNAGPLRPVIEGLLHKDPDERLDEPTTRSMLRRIIAESAESAETAEAAPLAAAETTVLPAVLPAVDAAKDGPRTVPPKGGAPVAEAPEPAAAPAAEPTGGPAAGSGDADRPEPGKRGAGALGGLLGTVRVGSRTAPEAPAATPPAAEPAGPAAEAPATAVLPVTGPDGGERPPGGGTVYGGGIGHRIREWRSQPPAERRPTPQALLIYLVVLVLLATGIVLGVRALSGGDGNRDRATGGHPATGSPKPSDPAPAPPATAGSPSPATTPPATPSGSTAPSGSTGPSGSTAPTGSTTPSDPETGTGPVAGGGDDGGDGDDSGNGGGSSDGDAAVPAGYQTYTSNGEDFSIAVPKGMKYTGVAKDGGDQLEYKGLVLIVQRRTDASASALDDWRDRESQSHSGWPDYQRIGDVHQVSYRGWNAADWEWTYNRGPAAKHSLSRAFVVDKKHAYLIQWITPEDKWDSAAAKEARDVAFRTFEPED
ncbi:serine/threonine-protein kinase [Streptomyces sp. NPDC092296]|uniref:serine/threonine-protein kinase n=1 Tax=Streptomyces sp. NPDC092296 TaxID=3366012 RepID=UPI003803B7CE